MMDELIAFLNARLDDEERAAINSRTLLLIVHTDRCSGLGSDEEATFRHFDRYNPKRALAEVDAKRRIIALADEANSLDTAVDLDRRVEPRDMAAEPYVGDLILRVLALPYADHPDYRPEWQPTE